MKFTIKHMCHFKNSYTHWKLLKLIKYICYTQINTKLLRFLIPGHFDSQMLIEYTIVNLISCVLKQSYDSKNDILQNESWLESQNIVHFLVCPSSLRYGNFMNEIPALWSCNKFSFIENQDKKKLLNVWTYD